MQAGNCTPASWATWDLKFYRCGSKAAQPETPKGKRTTIPTIQAPHPKPEEGVWLEFHPKKKGEAGGKAIKKKIWWVYLRTICKYNLISMKGNKSGLMFARE